jgi:carbon-monoxide dehydrogenase small subunit
MSPTEPLTLVVNGRPVTPLASPTTRLLDYLRTELGLTGTKEGCGAGECGACTVLLDGRPVNACLVLLGSVAGRTVTTIEGLSDGAGGLHPVQQAFVDAGAVQCGFCTPGAVLTAAAFVDAGNDYSAAAARAALSGNLCRCTGYAKILQAVERAVAGRREAP